MKFLTRKTGIITGLGALLSGSAYAQDTGILDEDAQGTHALEDAAARHDAQVIWVDEGTRLYQVASTIARQTSGSTTADGAIHKEELIMTYLCDDWQLRGRISTLNNTIADLTATVADEVDMDDLAAAMRLDSQMVKLVDGTTCAVHAQYETINQSDGIRGDGFANMHGQNGLVPVVVPNGYLPPSQSRMVITPRDEEVIPSVTQEISPEPVDTSKPVDTFEPIVTSEPVATFEPVDTPRPEYTSRPCPEVHCPEAASLYDARTRGNFALGAHHILEGGAAPLAGFGGWAEGRLEIPVTESGTIAFDLNHLWVSHLVYKQNDRDQVLVADGDVTVGYVFPFIQSARLQLGANGDLRTADVSYEGVSAHTGNFGVGPQFALLAEGKRTSLDARVSYGWGRTTTDVDVPSFEATSDPTEKAKVDLTLGYSPIRAFGLRALGSLEHDMVRATTQDGGLLSQDHTNYTVGGRVDLGNWVTAGADYVRSKDEGNDTNSVRIVGGLKHTF